MSAIEQPTSASTRRKPRKMGPFSRERSLEAVDGRTQAGKVLRATEAEILQAIGPKAPIGQRLIARSAALKATRITLLTKKIVADGNLAEGTDTLTLSWMNGLRADLSALGLLIKPGTKAPDDADDGDDLATYVRAGGAKAGAA